MSGIHTTHEYKITSDPAFMDEVYGTTQKIREILNGNYPKLTKKAIIDKLMNDIEKYPTIPQFKQQLASAYMLQNLPNKAIECNNWLYKEHPTYLFALLNKAFDSYIQNDYEGMLAFLGEDLQLESLYPERKEFHKDEIMNYLSACAIYRNATETDDEQKDIIIDIMMRIDKTSAVLKRTIDTIYTFNMVAFQEKMDKFKEYEKRVETVFNQSIPKTNKPPDFKIAIFKKLYEYQADIDHSIIKEILQLPQAIIKTECQKIIDDSIARFHYFNDDNNIDDNTFFVIHVMLILGETGNEENLPLLLQILRQGEDYCDLYLSDILTEKVWQCIYKLSKNSISTLLDFLREPNIYVFCKTTVTNVLEQYVLTNIIDRKTIINEYANLLSFFLEKKNDSSIIDTLIVADFISFLVEANAEEHYSLIEKMYEAKLVSIMSIGTFKEVIDFKQNYTQKDPDEIDTIYEIYDELFDWSFNNDDDTIDDYYDDADYEKILPVRTEPKIGRNDECPCGSGKKYKKCCL
jgi:Protein of unknown function (DUF1186)/SEC-C motif